MTAFYKRYCHSLRVVMLAWVEPTPGSQLPDPWSAALSTARSTCGTYNGGGMRRFLLLLTRSSL